jgi:hypothetical protein
MYNGGAWSQLTTANPEGQWAANLDGNNREEIVADLGSSGLWLWNGGAWGQLSAVNVECLAAGGHGCGRERRGGRRFRGPRSMAVGRRRLVPDQRPEPRLNGESLGFTLIGGLW